MSKALPEGYFSSNIESVREDVECTCGILKKRWKMFEAWHLCERYWMKRLLKDTCWQYYTTDSAVQHERGVYHICDNGYLPWPTPISPFVQVSKALPEEYFSSNIESVQKHVECTFGILKKRWCVLSNCFLYHDIKIWENVFITCFVHSPCEQVTTRYTYNCHAPITTNPGCSMQGWHFHHSQHLAHSTI